MKINIAYNDTVTIHYTGTFKDNNEVFDSSENSGPFEFVVGSDKVIDAINEAIIGMTVGDKTTLDVSPEKGYGHYQEELIIKIPTEKLPEDASAGDVLDEAVTQMQWLIQEIGEETSVIDGNHPLAGKELTFDIEIVDLEKQTSDEK